MAKHPTFYGDVPEALRLARLQGIEIEVGRWTYLDFEDDDDDGREVVTEYFVLPDGGALERTTVWEQGQSTVEETVFSPGSWYATPVDPPCGSWSGVEILPVR